MKYGFIDESGSPGVANCKKDCLAISLVIVDDLAGCCRNIETIEKLIRKLHLSDDYEFHCSSNSTRPQAEFLKLLSTLKFRFVTVVIHKNDFKRTASYSRIARSLVDEIKKHFSDIKIEMDSNPTLYAEIRKCIRESKLPNVKVRQRNSRSSRLIQVADYVVNISAKKTKGAPKSREYYSSIAKKALSFIEILDKK